MTIDATQLEHRASVCAATTAGSHQPSSNSKIDDGGFRPDQPLAPALIVARRQAEVCGLAAPAGETKQWLVTSNADQRLRWSNHLGWTLDNYDVFTDAEHLTLNLPLDGNWQPAPSVA